MLDEQLQDVFRRVFGMPGLVIADEMTADDVEKWDSMTHVSLIVEIEKTFGVKFRNSEIARLQCIGDLKALLRKHKPELG